MLNQSKDKSRSIVALVKCQDYEEDSLNVALRNAFNLIGGLESIIRRGAKVLLKPNIMMPKPPGFPANVHPNFLRSIIAIFQEAGAEVMIGESSAGSLAGLSFTDQALAQSGVVEIAKKHGVPLINFDLSSVIKKKTDNPFAPLLPVAKAAFDVDLVVSLPKLKTHTYGTIITGAVKNCYGLVPGQIKAEFHRLAPTPEKFFTIIRDLYAIVRPQLAIMDAVMAMEGDGPSAGEAKHVGYLLLSRDPVAIDAVAAELIGVRATRVITTRLCAEANLGAGDLESIEVRGEDLKKAVVRDFKLPVVRVTNPYLYQLVIKLTKTQPQINSKLCTRCYVCKDSCPVQAIAEKNGLMVIDRKECIRCLCCCEVCPNQACRPKRVSLIGEIFSKIISSRW